MQDEFFDNVINNRDSKHRYFAIIEDIKHPAVHYLKPGDNGLLDTIWRDGEETEYDIFLGMAGLTNIEWENGTAEISLIIDPKYRGKGNGWEAVNLLLREAFYSMRLYSVFGEVYNCGNRGFWEKVVEKKDGYKTDLKDRKYYNGEMHSSMWFSFSRMVDI